MGASKSENRTERADRCLASTCGAQVRGWQPAGGSGCGRGRVRRPCPILYAGSEALRPPAGDGWSPRPPAAGNLGERGWEMGATKSADRTRRKELLWSRPLACILEINRGANRSRDGRSTMALRSHQLFTIRYSQDGWDFRLSTFDFGPYGSGPGAVVPGCCAYHANQNACREATRRPGACGH